MDLHNKGYIHSDLKPDNIMVESEEYKNLRIIDLGMTTPINDTIVGGTPFFMPAQHLGDNKANDKFDSFGIAMTIMATETNIKLPMFFSAAQVKKMQGDMIDRTRRMSSIKVKGEDELGFFVSLWHKIKRFFGFTVMETFSDLM